MCVVYEVVIPYLGPERNGGVVELSVREEYGYEQVTKIELQTWIKYLYLNGIILYQYD